MSRASWVTLKRSRSSTGVWRSSAKCVPGGKLRAIHSRASLPVSRRELLTVRAATGLAELLILAVVPSLVIPILSSGVGQSPHLTGAWFLQLTGLKMVHVPFRGAGPALQAALAGDIQILFDNLYPTLPQVQDGKLNALAVTTPERAALAPNVPTMRESAPELAKFDVSSWFGIFLPKSVPAPVLDALNKEIKVFLERDDIKEQMAKIGARTDYGTPQQYSDFLAAETAKFGAIIKQEGLQMDAG